MAGAAGLQVDFQMPVRFEEQLVVCIEHMCIGRSSLKYRFIVRRGQSVVFSGVMAVVHVLGQENGDAVRPEGNPYCMARSVVAARGERRRGRALAAA